MLRVIISDTSCFILLNKLDQLELLKLLYGTVTTTPEVKAEYGRDLPPWVIIQAVKDTDQKAKLHQQVDNGEASAIALAIEIPNSTLILDDLKARKLASELGLQYTGTVGVIVKAKLSGIIPSIKPLLRKLSETNFRLTAEIEYQALVQAGELLN